MMEFILAANEKLGKITSSPLPTPNVLSASSNAVVPLEVVTEYPPPRYLEKFFSNCSTYEPFEDIHPDLIASKALLNSSLPKFKFAIGYLLKFSIVDISLIILFSSTKGIHLNLFLFFLFCK